MNLREARARKLLTMRGLAEAAGISLSTVQSAEQGRYKPSLKVVKKIADALGMAPTEVDELRASIESAARGRARKSTAG